MGETVAVGGVLRERYPFDGDDLDALIERLDAVLDAWFMAEVAPALREASAVLQRSRRVFPAAEASPSPAA